MVRRIFSKISFEFSNRILIPIILSLSNALTISHQLPLSGLKSRLLKIIGMKLASPVFIDSGFKCYLPKNVTIDKNSSLGHYNKIWAFNNIYIGPYVQTALGVTFISGGHRTDNYAPLEENQDIILEGENWIGANVTILGGTRIGRGAIIAAGAVVTGIIPAYTIAGGIPARVIKQREAADHSISPFGIYHNF